MKKYFFYLILVTSFVCLNRVYSSISVYEEDLELSKKIPLISGIEPEKILERDKVAITLCFTPLKGYGITYDHAALVFEMKDLNKNEIDLFAVHFGGDGYSEIIDKNLPTIDDSYETLKKVYRGKKKIGKSVDYERPIYSRYLVFVVDKNNAIEAIKNVESENELNYSITGYNLFYNNVYNCCTYVDKVLKDAGINIKFHDPVKNASSLKRCCDNYQPINSQEKLTPRQYYDYLEIDEYRESVQNLFYQALKFKRDNNYNESMRDLLESARRGHPVAQCFIGFCYYNNDEVKSEFKRIEKYAQKYQYLQGSLDDITCFYNLLLKYKEFSSSEYFKKSIKHNENKAFKWVERSAKKGFARAQSDLGYFYQFGKGINIDEKQAIIYTKEAANEDAVAAQNLYNRYLNKKKEAAKKAEEEAQKHFRYKMYNENPMSEKEYYNFLREKTDENNKKVEELFGFSDDLAKIYLDFSINQGFTKQT